jgi:hypothetical protein
MRLHIFANLSLQLLPDRPGTPASIKEPSPQALLPTMACHNASPNAVPAHLRLFGSSRWCHTERPRCAAARPRLKSTRPCVSRSRYLVQLHLLYRPWCSSASTQGGVWLQSVLAPAQSLSANAMVNHSLCLTTTTFFAVGSSACSNSKHPWLQAGLPG